MLEQHEAYFKVEMAVPNEQLKKDENELNAPEKQKVKEEVKPPEKKNKWSYLKKWFTLSTPKPPEPEESDEEPEILATRFISFTEGSIVVL